MKVAEEAPSTGGHSQGKQTHLKVRAPERPGNKNQHHSEIPGSSTGKIKWHPFPAWGRLLNPVLKLCWGGPTGFCWADRWQIEVCEPAVRTQRCAGGAASGLCGVEREHICVMVHSVLPRGAASTPHPAHTPPDGRALGSVPTLTSGQAPDGRK